MAPDKIINKAFGPTRQEHLENIQYLANLQMIRVNNFEVFTESKKQLSGNDTTSEKVLFDRFEPGYIYIITNVTAVDITDAAHQISIFARIGGEDKVLEAATVSAARDSVSYIGQLFLKEGDQIGVEFRSIGANDDIFIFMNGYKIRR